MKPPRTPRGQSLVEFALALPLLVLLLVGVFDLGRAVYASNAVSNAAHAGARVAIVNQNQADIVTAAASKAVAVEPIAVSAPAYDCPPTNAPGVGCLVSVTVTYQYAAATPLIDRITGPITISSTVTMPMERICPDATTSPPLASTDCLTP